MKSLYLRIWLTVVAALVLFALVSGWVWQRHLDQERSRLEVAVSERIAAWGDLVQRSLPSADAPPREQADALREWSFRLRVPMALDDAKGQRIGASESFLRREADGVGPPPVSVRLDDGRTLWIARRLFRRPGLGAEAGPGAGDMGAGLMRPRGDMPRMDVPRPDGPLPMGPRADTLPPGARMQAPPQVAPTLRMPMLPALGLGLPPALGPVLLLVLLLLAVAAGAYPVVRRLTRRLEALQQGVEAFGRGQLGQRVAEDGKDEVAAVATTFNRAAERIETLVRSHQSLLANASHELRSPLARLKMAVAMFAEAGDSQRTALRREIDANVAELDALVEEVLLASRLDATQVIEREDAVDLLGLAAEEAARVGAQAGGDAVVLRGSERLLRRALRNLLENARRYGGQDVSAEVRRVGPGGVRITVCDRGPGVPQAYRERIFEPFFRLPGHAEREGGVGLGLSLVRQIAERHGGSVHCEPRPGGGSCFVLSLPGA
ncbi:MAG: HAMP domain-containing histidine kinase [Burkholderiales bacterium]|nr:HAMP domain-containing histidine kinase [Burkholderiales bacterium]